MATIPRPSDPSATRREPVAITLGSRSEPADVWASLRDAEREPWLNEIGALPVATDDLQTCLDIWAVALAGALRNPARRAAAARVLGRLRRLSDDLDAGG